MSSGDNATSSWLHDSPPANILLISSINICALLDVSSWAEQMIRIMAPRSVWRDEARGIEIEKERKAKGFGPQGNSVHVDDLSQCRQRER